ncbi:hypothetical protein EYZ11_007723 [Aspergillus tanneri]|uniref:Enoyl reductase (ER) domain-containing protein n=1 Tax=Aspergillus tanneri TaxID=1220188 RepID=A0A4V3UNW2_9EURO|nr:hypothetical protein EYZ11_007723 [Aspergillus tanneri]
MSGRVMAKAIIAREPVEPLAINLSLEDVAVHPPGDDEILVDMRASGICHTDLVLCSVPRGSIGINYPKVPGHEGSGIVRAIGKSVKSVEDSHPAYCETFAQQNYLGCQGSMTVQKTGEVVWSRFFGQSSFAQVSVVSEASVVNARELLHQAHELDLFAPLGCGFQTGMGAVQNIACAGPNDVVMILGLGAVGLGALMTAKIRGCKAIIAVDRVKARIELAKSLGATHTLDTSSADFTSLDEAIKLIIPAGVSVVIETTGHPAIFERGLRCTHARGKVVFIGIPPLGYQFSFDLSEHINHGRSILGCIEGDCIPQKV